MVEDWSDLPFWHKQLPEILQQIRADERSGKVVLPPLELMFRSLKLTQFEDINVVILGQDPYPTVGHANGLAFSVNPETKPLPKSLQNIFKELESDVGIKRTCGDLTDWAKQGVLLLNTSLSVVQGSPGSHSSIGWAALTSQIICAISDYKENVVFILWGRHAQQKGAIIDREKHLVIESAHPSPLAAHNGFFGSKCFSKTNAYLTSHNKPNIHW